MRCINNHLLNSCHPVLAGKKRAVIDPAQESGYWRRCRIIQLEKGTEILHRDPLIRPTRNLHELVQHFGNIRMSGHGTLFKGILVKKRWWNFLTGTLGRGRSGDVQLSRPHRIRSSRNLRILGWTCIHPGGFCPLHGVRGSHRMRRCVRCCLLLWIQLAGSCWFFV